jgi:hypothetical protein
VLSGCRRLRRAKRALRHARGLEKALLILASLLLICM